MSERNWDSFESLISSPLLSEFYQRNTVLVAQDLLGKILIVKPEVKSNTGATVGRIVETEAYRADDPASHSSRGETPRCSVMFGEPGVAYVYYIYGMYEMLNFVTEPKGLPGAVLIRALEPLYGQSTMAKHSARHLTKIRSSRNFSSSHINSNGNSDSDSNSDSNSNGDINSNSNCDPALKPVLKKQKALTSGPGRLCRAMGIKMSHNRHSLQGPLLYVVDDGYRPESISKSSRVGIRVGTEKLWRFFITDHFDVSRPDMSRADVSHAKLSRADTTRAPQLNRSTGRCK